MILFAHGLFWTIKDLFPTVLNSKYCYYTFVYSLNITFKNKESKGACICVTKRCSFLLSKIGKSGKKEFWNRPSCYLYIYSSTRLNFNIKSLQFGLSAY